MTRKKQRAFAELTWQDLEDWAGARVVGRGRGYLKQVSDLKITADGKLLAWVYGSKQYATQVGFDADGKLFSNCTCPYGLACKHAVAMILVYLDAVKNGRKVPLADPDDERLEAFDDTDEEDSDETEDDDRDGFDEMEDDREPAPSRKPGSGERHKSSGQALQAYLDGLNREALAELLLEMAGKHIEVREDLNDRASLKSGKTGQLAKAVRKEIDSLASEPAWSNHWSGEGNTPDYSRVRERLRALLAAGQADEVVALGEHLLKKGIQQVEMSDDEGETGREIGECMVIVFQALPKSSGPISKQLMWEINARLADDYAILDDAEGPVSGDDASPTDWSAVADELAKRLTAIPATGKDTGDGSFHRKYERHAIMRWQILALEKAKRKEEIIPLLEREVPVTDCYPELVDALLAAKRRQDAESRAREGFARTVGSLPGIAWDLVTRLRAIADANGNKPLVAAYCTMEFFNQPDVSGYAALEKAATAAGVWPAVRHFVLLHLETGVHPDRLTAGPGKPEDSPAWPLPPTGLALPAEKPGRHYFPDTETLIDIAIREKRNDDALKWHEQAKKRRGLWGGDSADKVATAVQRTHPDAALKLWQRLAEEQIARVTPSAYQTAGQFLNKAKALCAREKRMDEWKKYLEKLRAENQRRPRMKDVLDKLENRRRPILAGNAP